MLVYHTALNFFDFYLSRSPGGGINMILQFALYNNLINFFIACYFSFRLPHMVGHS